MPKVDKTIQNVCAGLVAEASRITCLFLEKYDGGTVTEKEIFAMHSGIQHLGGLLAGRDSCVNCETVLEAFEIIGRDVLNHPDLWYFTSTLRTLAVLLATRTNSTLTQNERAKKLRHVEQLIR
jgi:hypothetical protein